MKKLAMALLVLPALAFKCEKDNLTWLEGKVVRISCASFVVQVLDNDHIGQDNWRDMLDNNKEHDNVINASNKCQIPESIQKGNIIRFRVNNPQLNNCALCFMYDAPPTVAFDIKDISVKSTN